MVEVSEKTIDAIEEISEKNDIETDRVQKAFKERYNELEERSEGVSDEVVENMALRQTRNWAARISRVPSDEVELLTIGGSIRNTKNGDMFFGTAVVDENPEESPSKTKLASVRIFDEETASEVYNAFDEVGNVVSGTFNVSSAGLTGQAEVSDIDETTFDVVRPDDREPLIQEIRDHVPEVSIENIAENLTETTRGDDGNLYNVSSDIRRIEADIFDGYKDNEGGFGIYTVRDETVFDEEDIVESDVFNAEEANENAVPGLTVWVDPAKMEYGSESVVEFFGTVTTNEDGEISMNADGMVANPLMVTEFDGYVADEEQEQPHNDAETENVDRMKI